MNERGLGAFGKGGVCAPARAAAAGTPKEGEGEGYVVCGMWYVGNQEAVRT